MDPSQVTSRVDVAVDTGMYQAPSYSPDGRTIAFLVPEAERSGPAARALTATCASMP